MRGKSLEGEALTHRKGDEGHEDKRSVQPRGMEAGLGLLDALLVPVEMEVFSRSTGPKLFHLIFFVKFCSPPPFNPDQLLARGKRSSICNVAVPAQVSPCPGSWAGHGEEDRGGKRYRLGVEGKKGFLSQQLRPIRLSDHPQCREQRAGRPEQPRVLPPASCTKCCTNCSEPNSSRQDGLWTSVQSSCCLPAPPPRTLLVFLLWCFQLFLKRY